MASQRATSWLDARPARFVDPGLRAGYLQLAEDQRIRVLAELT